MSRSQLVLSVAQLNELQGLLAQFSQQADVRCAILGDLSGQDIVSWAGRDGADLGSVAALAAGDLMATLEIGRLLGGQRACNMIVQEHEDMTILVARVGQGLLLLLATARDVPLGWSRLALKRAIDRILPIVGKAANTPPPPGISDDFAQSFSSQLDSIW
ncbi:MAG: roadblock/LC7 domain-containing protein [Chloroflexales bacterium]|nr:roadblock/LC7 domain-containing protein [Chloroflexales bacterium]